MFTNSLRLFLKGKLFREPRMVLRQWAIGVVATALVLVLLAKLGAPLWLAVLLASLSGGALQPYLFRHLKYN
ncbi:MAG: hypothetical protein V4792_05595 [Pseudomonadota bacterium]